MGLVELNYRPHAYQAASCEHESGSEVPTRLPFTNILLSMSRIYEHLANFREHFAHLNGHHNGHHYREAAARKRYSVPTRWLTKQTHVFAIELRRARIANLEGDRFRRSSRQKEGGDELPPTAVASGTGPGSFPRPP
jgi:hypothetical protein